MKLILPKLTAYQQQVYDWLHKGEFLGSDKVAVVKSCRQSGKSFFCACMLTEVACTKPKSTSVYISPTLDQSRNVFQLMLKGLTGMITSSNNSLLTINFRNGSRVLFKSTGQGDSNLRGFTVSGLLILDECAYLDDETIYTVLPFASVHQAPILCTSTPLTQMGFFYDMYMRGIDGNDPLVQAFDWAKHPEISRFLTDERKRMYKASMSRAKYKTEVEGDFLIDEGLLFVNISNCINDAPDTSEGQYVYVGIDFAAGNEGDYTVITVLNSKGEMIDMQRTNALSPMFQVDWIVALLDELSARFNIRKIVAEKNSIGAVYIDALRQKCKHEIQEFVTTNDSKQKLVTDLQCAFEQCKVSVLNKPVLLQELQSYEAQISPNSKVIRYNGKNGTHDDTVMSLMFAYHAYKTNFGNYSYYSFSKPSRKLSAKERYG